MARGEMKIARGWVRDVEGGVGHYYKVMGKTGLITLTVFGLGSKWTWEAYGPTYLIRPEYVNTGEQVMFQTMKAAKDSAESWYRSRKKR